MSINADSSKTLAGTPAADATPAVAELDTIVSLAKRRGFVFPSSEIYGGINAVWDYGPLGVELKNNVKRAWWRSVVQQRHEVVGLDAGILMHPQVWKTSGHVGSFSDPLVECTACKRRYRLDELPGTGDLTTTQLADAEIVAKMGLKCPDCEGSLTAPRRFNLMFKTFMGPVEDEAAVVYLRPETAQGAYVQHKNVRDSSRKKIHDLPSHNRLRRHHENRWALDTAADSNFADMYLHPQETSYDLGRLFAFVQQCGLHFCGFSNPSQWDPARLLQGELLERAQALPERQQWELVETLDPDISHFEFFLSREPITPGPWDNDEALLATGGERNRCLWGWPSTALLGPDLEPLDIEPGDLALLQSLEGAPEGMALGSLPLAMDQQERLLRARRLIALRLLHPLVG
jgi:hypothetical protein